MVNHKHSRKNVFLLCIACVLGGTVGISTAGVLLLFSNPIAHGDFAAKEAAWSEHWAAIAPQSSKFAITKHDEPQPVEDKLQNELPENRERSFPNQNGLSRDSLIERITKFCPDSFPNWSVGRLALAQAILDTEVALLAGQQQVTEEEYEALVFFRVHEEFAPGNPLHKEPFDAEGTQVEWDEVLDRSFKHYRGFVEVFQIWQKEGTFDESAQRLLQVAKSDPSGVGFVMNPNSILAELRRLRIEGKNTANLWRVPSGAANRDWLRSVAETQQRNNQALRNLALGVHLVLNPENIANPPEMSGASIAQILGSKIMGQGIPALNSVPTRREATKTKSDKASETVVHLTILEPDAVHLFKNRRISYTFVEDMFGEGTQKYSANTDHNGQVSLKIPDSWQTPFTLRFYFDGFSKPYTYGKFKPGMNSDLQITIPR